MDPSGSFEPWDRLSLRRARHTGKGGGIKLNRDFAGGKPRFSSSRQNPSRFIAFSGELSALDRPMSNPSKCLLKVTNWEVAARMEPVGDRRVYLRRAAARWRQAALLQMERFGPFGSANLPPVRTARCGPVRRIDRPLRPVDHVTCARFA